MNHQSNHCNQQFETAKIHGETNSRIYDRNIPSQVLQPYIEARSVSTKYSLLPIVDPRKKIDVPMAQYPTFSTNSVFNPGNSQSPWSGYASSVNQESELRNQIFALQKCSQAVYVPSSTSDLYQYHFSNQSQGQDQIQQPFPDLFQKQHFDSFNPNTSNIGQGVFLNSTRAQLKENYSVNYE
jgi:hypothetical protein